MGDQRRRRRREEEERQLELERRRRIARQRKRRRQVMKRRLILASIGMVFLLAAIIAGVVTIRGKIAEKKAQEAKEKKQQEEEAARLEEENNTLHMVAVGDNMIHDAIIQAGKKNDWNFDFLYENIKEDIEKADVAIVNQETPFVKSHSAAVGYPDFATPTEVGDALAAAGFDVVTHATEHSFDQGSDGIINSTSFWKKNYPEITRLGIHSDEKEKNYEIRNVKNFKIALLNYSTLLSENHKVKKDETYMINLYSEERAKADIKEAKEEADLTVVMLHGGKSDSTEPDEKLLDRVSFLSEQGADILSLIHI